MAKLLIRHTLVGSCACLILLAHLGPFSATAQTETAATADGGAAPAGTCPLTSEDFAQTDYASVRTACDITTMTGDVFCRSCVCGLGTAIVLGFEQAGIKVNGQRVSDLAASGDINALNNLLTNCSAIMGIELLQAGALTAQALGQLGSCDVNQTSLNCAGPADSVPEASGGLAATSDAASDAAAAAAAAAAPSAAAVQEGSQQQPAAKPAVSAAANMASTRHVAALLAAVSWMLVLM